jgi:acyl transferase domain-containing protein
MLTVPDEILKPEGQSRLSLAEFSQPCCTAVQVALVDVLHAWGVQPAAVVGHSSGEIAAAYASNALSAPDAILVAYYRGKVSSEIHTAGSMAAVSLGRRKVGPYLVQGVVIGCVNSPSSVTLSGDTEALEQVTKAISNDHPGALVRKLRVGCAYHSHHMAAAVNSYQSYMRGISATSAKIPFYSAVRGGKLDDRLLGANYWVDNLVSPVSFSDALGELARNIPPASVILEIGPHAALAGPIRQVLQAEKSGHHQYTSTLKRGQDARTSLATCAGHLFQCGAKVDFAAMLSKRGQVLVDLPTYSWTRDGPYWAENRLSREYRFRRFPKHDILGSPVVETSSFNPAWRNMLSLDDVPWLRDHVVVDDVVFPGACYAAMAGEAVRQLTTATDYTIREFNIENALLLHEGVTTELITHLEPVQLTTTLDSAWYNFKISSLSMNSGARWTRHAFGQIRGGRSCPSISATPPIQASYRGVDTLHWYAAMKRVGLNYGPRFQCLADISAEANARTATARIRHLALGEESTYALHPSALDCVLQLFSVAATHGQSRRLGQLSVPTYIEELYISSSRDDVRVSVIADVTTTGAITGSAFGNVGDEPTLELKNLTLSPLAGAADARETDTHAAAELLWKPDISFLDQGNLMQTAEDCSSSLNVLERMMLACAVECHLRLKSRRPKRKYLEKYLAWMNHVYEQAASSQYPGVVDSQQLTALGSTGRCVLIEEAFQDLRHTTAWPHATAVHRLFSHMDSIMAGKTEALSVLMDDDLLGRIYGAVHLTDASQFFRLFAHMMPNLRILEIGAGTGATTASILETLSDKTLKHVRDYSTYTFTDISPAFLNQAKERFKNHTAVEYRVLDITKDPVEQGFTSNSFDLIVASNVSHQHHCLKY